MREQPMDEREGKTMGKKEVKVFRFDEKHPRIVEQNEHHSLKELAWTSETISRLVAGGVILISGMYHIQKLLTPELMSGGWLYGFLDERFPRIDNLGDFFRTIPETMDIFMTEIVRGDFVNVFLTAAYLLALCGLVFGFLPLRKHCVSMRVFSMWAAGKLWSLKETGRNRRLYVLGVSLGSFLTGVCLTMPYVSTVCCRAGIR